jgi:hypothetical protein
VLEVDPTLCTQAMLHSGKKGDAIRLLEGRSAADPRNPVIYRLLIALLVEDGQFERASRIVSAAAASLGKDAETSLLGTLLIATRTKDQKTFETASNAVLKKYPDSIDGLLGRLEWIGPRRIHDRIVELVRFCRFLPKQGVSDAAKVRELLENALSDAGASPYNGTSDDIAKVISSCGTQVRWDTLFNPRIWSYLDEAPTLPDWKTMDVASEVSALKSMLGWNDLKLAVREASKIDGAGPRDDVWALREVEGDALWLLAEYSKASQVYLSALHGPPDKSLSWQRTWTKAAIAAWRSDNRNDMDGVLKSVMGAPLAVPGHPHVFEITDDGNVQGVLQLIAGCQSGRLEMCAAGLAQWDTTDDWPGADWTPKLDNDELVGAITSARAAKSPTDVCDKYGPLGKVAEEMMARYTVESSRFRPEGGFSLDTVLSGRGSKWDELALLTMIWEKLAPEIKPTIVLTRAGPMLIAMAGEPRVLHDPSHAKPANGEALTPLSKWMNENGGLWTGAADGVYMKPLGEEFIGQEIRVQTALKRGYEVLDYSGAFSEASVVIEDSANPFDWLAFARLARLANDSLDCRRAAAKALKLDPQLGEAEYLSHKCQACK